jgi:DNA-binding response OmpR family regulator
MSKQILVIDDDESVRKAFALALEDSSYGLDTADCGESGAKKFNDGDFSLVFLDLKMPGINGVDTLRLIRKKSEKTPVYIVTAFHKEFFDELKDVQAEGLRFQLVRKPLTFEEIGTITESVLGQKKATSY